MDFMSDYTESELQDVIIFLRAIKDKAASLSLSLRNKEETECGDLFDTAIKIFNSKRRLPVMLVNEVLGTLLKITPYLEPQKVAFSVPIEKLTFTNMSQAILMREVIGRTYCFEYGFSLAPLKRIHAVFLSISVGKINPEIYAQLLNYLFPDNELSNYNFLYNSLCKEVDYANARQAQQNCVDYIENKINFDQFNLLFKKLKILKHTYETCLSRTIAAARKDKEFETAVTALNSDFINLYGAWGSLKRRSEIGSLPFYPVDICEKHYRFIYIWTICYQNYNGEASFSLGSPLSAFLDYAPATKPCFLTDMESLANMHYPPAQYVMFHVKGFEICHRMRYLINSAKNGYAPAQCTVGIMLCAYFLESYKHEIDSNDIPSPSSIAEFNCFFNHTAPTEKQCLTEAQDYFTAAAHQGYARAYYYQNLLFDFMAKQAVNEKDKNDLRELSFKSLRLAALRQHPRAEAHFMMLSCANGSTVFPDNVRTLVKSFTESSYFADEKQFQHKYWISEMLELLHYEIGN